MLMLLVCGDIYRGHMGLEFDLVVIFIFTEYISTSMQDIIASVM